MFKRVFALLFLVVSTTSYAQESYPRTPVKIVVAYPAGSTMDVCARLIAQGLQAEIGGSFVVENKPGASGRIGAEYAAKAAPDGHTLFISGNSTHSANPSLFKDLKYDPVKDFTQITRVATMPYALVVGSKMPVKSFADFAAQGKASAGKLNYGFGSPASRVATTTLLRIQQFYAVGVPYPGQPPAITDLLGGRTEFLIADLAVLVPHVEGGGLRALTVLADRRSQILPQVPTMKEVGLSDYRLEAWLGVSGPAGISPEIVNRLSIALNKILARSDVNASLLKLGMEYSSNSPKDFESFVKDQLAVWTRNVREAGIQPE